MAGICNLREIYGRCLACRTYITHVWPVTRVSSQNAVQHVVIRPALAAHKCKTNRESAAVLGSGGSGTRETPTCWKMHRCGKVLEMSSLISSRLDSRSEDPASGQREAFQTRSSWDRLSASSALTFRLGLTRRGRAGLPLLLRPGQTDVVQV